MNFTRFVMVAALAIVCSPAVVAASSTHWVTVTVLHDGKPFYNAVVTVTDTEPPPEHFTGSTKPDGTYKFAIWPNARGEICVHAKSRKAPWLQSDADCVYPPYPPAIRLTLHAI